MTDSTRAGHSLKDYLNPRVRLMLALGFSSGLPFLLVGNTFAFWLRDEGTTLKAIGFISWVSLAYSLQFVWAPLLDRLPALKVLGLRRSWLIASQIAVAAGLVAMGFLGVRYGLAALGAAALAVAFASATQDIALAAWRIEIAENADELGLLTAANTLGYRIAIICADSLMLVSAQHLGWPVSYTLYGAAMGIGVIASLLAPEPTRADAVAAQKAKDQPLWSGRGVFDAVAGPFIAFFKTHGAMALVMLLAITFYRLPDFMRGPMVNPFFHDLGMSKDAIGLSRATVGLGTTFLGTLVAGFMSVRFGLMRTLILGAVLQSLGIAANALLVFTGAALGPFMVVMGVDDFSLGFAAISLVAYMSSLTSLGYVATQYALLSSVYALSGKFLKGFSGLLVDALAARFGPMNAYAIFFLGCALIAVPSILLFWAVGRVPDRPPASVNPA
ncbi:MAG TPA: MFS transporter [Rhizomicrobium sp.]|nr:MFS transporter [Rhizomicrobium sp.]